MSKVMELDQSQWMSGHYCKNTEVTKTSSNGKVRTSKVSSGKFSEEELTEGKQRQVANARERSRTQSVNQAFGKLRSRIPTVPENRKLSKIEILQLTISYIKHLSAVCDARLAGLSEESPCLKYPTFTGQTKESWRGRQMDTSRSDLKLQLSVCTFCLTARNRCN